MQKENKLPGVFGLLNEALSLYGKHFQVLTVIMALPIILDFVLSFYQLNPFLTFVIAIISIAASSWAFLSVLFVLKNGGGVIDNYRLALPNLPAYIYINILIAIATIPGVFLLGFTAIIYFVWFGFAAYVMITENYFGADALMRSREYVTHRWWRVAGRVLFIIVIVLAFQLLGILLAQILNSAGLNKLTHAPALTRGIITNCFSLFTVPLSFAYTYTLFLNLRATRPELAKQPVNARYKWLYIASPTTILILLIALVGIILGLLAKI